PSHRETFVDPSAPQVRVFVALAAAPSLPTRLDLERGMSFHGCGARRFGWLGTASNQVAVFSQVRGLRLHLRHVVGRGTAAPVAGLLPPAFTGHTTTPHKCPVNGSV